MEGMVARQTDVPKDSAACGKWANKYDFGLGAFTSLTGSTTCDPHHVSRLGGIFRLLIIHSPSEGGACPATFFLGNLTPDSTEEDPSFLTGLAAIFASAGRNP